MFAASTVWDEVYGLEEQQRRHLQRLHAMGVLWKHPGQGQTSSPVVFSLTHGGEVSSDGNCLFTVSQKAMGAFRIDASDLRRRTVRRFLEDFGFVGEKEKRAITEVIRHIYSPDLKNGWGIHIVQEEKLLAKKDELGNLDSTIDELMQIGMQSQFSEARGLFFNKSWVSFIWQNMRHCGRLLNQGPWLRSEIRMVSSFYFERYEHNSPFRSLGQPA